MASTAIPDAPNGTFNHQLALLRGVNGSVVSQIRLLNEEGHVSAIYFEFVDRCLVLRAREANDALELSVRMASEGQSPGYARAHIGSPTLLAKSLAGAG